MAYAPADEPALAQPMPRVVTASGVPMPVLSPRHGALTAVIAPVGNAGAPSPRMVAPTLTMTALDTQGLRLWIGAVSTRQKGYALMTMPDFAHAPELMDKPSLSFGDGFGATIYAGLRTDHFSGSNSQQPALVDLTLEPLIASIR
jgi:hypothetical protein